MICVEQQTVPVVYEKEASLTEINCNASNSELNNAVETGSNDESKIATLEKNISFLQAKQELLLNGLHAEIELLRRENKALQFRLVMCTCCTTRTNLSTEDLCQSRVLQLEDETRKLKQLLDAERRSKEALIEQIEVLKSSDRNIPKSQLSEVKEPTLRETLLDGATDESRSEQLTQPVPWDRDRSEVSETDRLLYPGKISSKGIPSPSLRQDSATSPIVLSPRTTLTAPEGVWARRSIVNTTNEDFKSLNTSTNAFTGHRIVPIRLPALRNERPLAHAQVNNVWKDILTPTLVTNSSRTMDGTQHATLTRYNSDSNVRADRNLTKKPSLPIFDNTEELATNLGPRAKSQPYGYNPGPFLPSLTKSSNTSLAAKIRKSRLTQRKRPDRS